LHQEGIGAKQSWDSARAVSGVCRREMNRVIGQAFKAVAALKAF